MIRTGITYRIFALMLALLVFASSTAFSVGMHYCNDELRSVSINSKALSCNDMDGVEHSQSCSSISQDKDIDGVSTFDTKSCCKDVVVQFHLDQDHKLPTMNIEVSPDLQYFAIAYVASYVNFTNGELNIHSFAHYKPPMIPRDIPVLVQSFLI